MSTGKDYYQVLGVGKNATQEEIKQAYRKLAREHHPDVVKDGDKEAAEKRFKEINEAYQILGDSQKRAMYDQYGSSAFAGGPQGAGSQGFGGVNQGQWGPFTYSYTSNGQNYGFGDFDPFDVFEEFFGFRGFGGQRSAGRKGKNLYYELVVSFSEAVFGVEKQVSVESGKVTIKIPSGVRNGTELRFTGKGMPSSVSGGVSGDLYISVKVVYPKDFEIYGDDILVRKEIDFVDAVLGTSVEVPVVDLSGKDGLGTAKLKIPEGTQPGTRFMLKGKGMPRLQGRGQGNLVAEIRIVFPKKLSRAQRDLLERYKML